MQACAAYLFMMAVGFVASGVLSSFVQLVSGKPMGFGIPADVTVAAFGGVLLRMLAGPAILMRNAYLGARQRVRSPVWFGVSALIAGAWSLVSGAFLLTVIFSL